MNDATNMWTTTLTMPDGATLDATIHGLNTTCEFRTVTLSLGKREFYFRTTVVRFDVDPGDYDWTAHVSVSAHDGDVPELFGTLTVDESTSGMGQPQNNPDAEEIAVTVAEWWMRQHPEAVRRLPPKPAAWRPVGSPPWGEP
jgi:hypothetical protein